jgi:peptide/nickel transport system ATP-binding protein
VLTGEVPSPIDPPAGCHFHPRCPIATRECSQVDPELKTVAANHVVACHHR